MLGRAVAGLRYPRVQPEIRHQPIWRFESGEVPDRGDPHLHLGIRAYGNAVCPQPLLLAILRGNPIPPPAAPTTGCYYPGRSTDWVAWLATAAQLLDDEEAGA